MILAQKSVTFKFFIANFRILLFLFLVIRCFQGYGQAQTPYKMTPLGDEAFQAILQFYQYDKDIPLDVRIVERIENENYIREKIVFRGIRESRVPGYLAVPKSGEPPFPCVLQMHGATMSKSDCWGKMYHYCELVTQELLASGYAVLALDMPYHGDRSYENNFEATRVMFFEKGGHRFRDLVVQTTLEYRRAMDYLESRTDIDANRIGAIGYSLGSVVSLILTGVDDRVKTTVVCVIPTIKPRRFLPSEEYLSGFAPQTFARSINKRPFLMLMGENDEGNCTVEEAKQLFDLIKSDKKELFFYESGHQLPAEHVTKAVEWFFKYL